MLVGIVKKKALKTIQFPKLPNTDLNHIKCHALTSSGTAVVTAVIAA